MNVQQLFLHVCDELTQVTRRGDEYAAIQASRLLRQLFLDDRPLFDQARSKADGKIKFTVGIYIDVEHFKQHPMTQAMVFASALGAFYPVHDKAERLAQRLPEPTEFSRDGFLSAAVIFALGNFVTVRQLIRHAANVLGGVHAGKAKTDEDRRLNEIHDTFKLGGQPLSLLHLFPICRVVLDAVEPLRMKAKASLTTSSTAADQEATVASLGNAGSIMFTCVHPMNDWSKNGHKYEFPAQTLGGASVTSVKHADRTFEIKIAGVSKQAITFRNPTPVCDARGLIVIITWELTEIKLYFNGDLVATANLEDS